MNIISNIWFWLGLLFAPVLFIVGIYQLGHIIGSNLYSNTEISFTSLLTSGELVVILAAIPALSVFIDSFNKAKSRFGN